MGKDRRYRPKRNFAEKRREKHTKKDEWDKTPQRSYAEIVRENSDFESYYTCQKIVPEEEWDAFITTMRENLPTAFRITGSKIETRALLEIIRGDFFREILNSKPKNDDTVENVNLKCLPFYPDNLAWQLQLTRADIRRSEAFCKLHNFLIAETNSGNISRQEVVSMIPPLVLDVRPSDKVLDMCAAPGSKTAQLIELIHADEKSPMPGGFVVANDIDNNRCYMLVHQAKRLNSPNILITNHDSSVMPNLISTTSDGSRQILKFDRILADVPCSGDGTMRKNPDIWCKWNPANGNNLHGIQFRIAKRGAELLNVGGRMVYSTCSLNPIENEAVLHRLLAESGNSLRLIDCSDLVPGLVFNPGINEWKPASKNLQYFSSWEEVPEELQTQIRPTMFPPTCEEASKFHLERCMRILPHHQDTGGFFVAVLEKIELLPWETETIWTMNPSTSSIVKELCKNGMLNNSKETSSTQDNELRGIQEKRKKFRGYREDPFVFFKDENEDVWPSIKNFYEISTDLDPQCLLVRCYEGKKKNIYLSSPPIRDIVENNENRIKIINTGVKTFVRCDNKNMTCAFRLAQEGLKNITHFIGKKRKVQVTKDDLILLLQNNDHRLSPEISKLDQSTQDQLKDFDVGSCVLQYEEDRMDGHQSLNLEMVGWRGTRSFRAYVPVHDAIHYLRLLGADFTKFEKNKFEANRNLSDIYRTEEKLHTDIHTQDQDQTDGARVVADLDQPVDQ